jgi:hypothetical protein
VHTPPGLGPRQFHGLDLLVKQGGGLGRDKEGRLAISSDALLTLAGVDLVLRIMANLRLHNHLDRLFDRNKKLHTRSCEYYLEIV